MRGLSEIWSSSVSNKGRKAPIYEERDESMINAATTAESDALELVDALSDQELSISEQLTQMPDALEPRIQERATGVMSGLQRAEFECQMLPLEQFELALWSTFLPSELYTEPTTVAISLDTTSRQQKQFSLTIISKNSAAALRVYIPLAPADPENFYLSTELTIQGPGSEPVFTHMTRQQLASFGQFFRAVVAGQIAS